MEKLLDKYFKFGYFFICLLNFIWSWADFRGDI